MNTTSITGKPSPTSRCHPARTYSRVIFSLLCLLFIVLPGVSQEVSKANTPPNDAEWTRRVVAWHPIADTSPNERFRYVGWDLPRIGWSAYLSRYVVPQIERGVRRVLIHNPWGRTPGEPMSFDQYLEAQDQGLGGLTNGFVEAWKPLVEGRYSNGEPVEVICYLGALDRDPSMLALRDPEQPDGSAAWQQRALASLQPALEAGMSIGFDSSSDLPADSPEFRLLQHVEALGHRVYVESRPRADLPHLHHFGVISTRQHWFRSDPDRYPGAAHNARNAQLTGEIIVLGRSLETGMQRRQYAERILVNTPFSIAVRLDRVISDGFTLADWQADAPATAPLPTDPLLGDPMPRDNDEQ